MPTFSLKYVSKMKIRKVKRHRLCWEREREREICMNKIHKFYSILCCYCRRRLRLPFHLSISVDANNVHHLSFAFASSNFEMWVHTKCYNYRIAYCWSLSSVKLRFFFFFCCFFLVLLHCCIYTYAARSLNVMIAKKHEPTVNKTERWTSSFACKLIKHLCLFALPDNVL